MSVIAILQQLRLKGPSALLNRYTVGRDHSEGAAQRRLRGYPARDLWLPAECRLIERSLRLSAQVRQLSRSDRSVHNEIDRLQREIVLPYPPKTRLPTPVCDWAESPLTPVRLFVRRYVPSSSGAAR